MAIPVFVINLDRRTDRWAAISDQLDRLGIKPRRVEALDGVHATGDDFEPFVNLDGWARRRHLDLASAACIVSHRFALVRFLAETDASAALILEDDVKLASDLPAFLTAAELALSGTRLLKLDVALDAGRPRPRRRSLGSPVAIIQGRQLHPIGSWIPGAGAYVVTREAAETIVQHCHRVTVAFDSLIFDLRISRLARRLRPVLVQPALAKHQATVFTSDIERYRKTVPQTSELRRLATSLRKLPRRTFVGWHLATGQMKRTKLRFADRVWSGQT